MADALLDVLSASGVDHIFANLGTDHAPLIEALARADAARRVRPRLILCPHEAAAMAAAHGFAQTGGGVPAVLVHVNDGTQNLGGLLHNAFRCRVPVLLLAGRSPLTLRGERPGSRDEYVHYVQDQRDQASLVRDHIKWEGDLRTGANADVVVRRALYLAAADPPAPVYLTLPREVLEEPYTAPARREARSALPRPAGIEPQVLERIARLLVRARRPVLLTTYAGRHPDTPAALARLAESVALPIVEVRPNYVNVRRDHPLHLGFVADEPIATADLILILDVDVPWLPMLVHPPPRARIVWIDCDPMKTAMPLHHFAADIVVQGESRVVVPLLGAAVRRLLTPADRARCRQRYQRIAARHAAMRAVWRQEVPADAGPTLPPRVVARHLAACVGERSLVVNETVTNFVEVCQALHWVQPGQMFGSGGSSLGWGIGAALGAKLAHPEREVIACVGDGAFLFGEPLAVYWAARRYEAPFLTVVFNNAGWAAVRASTRRLHPTGAAAQAERYGASLAPGVDIAAAAAACGAWATPVADAGSLEAALTTGLRHVRAGRAAVIDVRLAPVEPAGREEPCASST